MASNPVSDKELIQAFDELLLQELDEAFGALELRPAGFGITIKEYMEAKNASESTARRVLFGSVAKLGWKKKRMQQESGHPVWVYYK